jgi:type I restriction enzyme, S subunit
MSSEANMSLRDYVSLQRGTTYKGKLVGLPGPVLLGLASIQPNGGFRRGGFKTYGGECPEKISLRPGDIYVSLKDVTQSGDLLGSISRVPADVASGRLTQDTVKLVFDGLPISAEYLYWLLRTPYYREYCKGRGTGTTTLGLARDDLLDFPVPSPSEADLLLVEVLEAIEKRIALLREANITLESIIHAVFKSWFVNFDPVRARWEGRIPDGMHDATAALFPDSFVESELGSVPRGWGYGTLSDFAVLNPESWTAKKHPETLAYIDLANAKDNEIATVTQYPYKDAPSRARRILKQGDTIVGTVRPGNRSFAYIHNPPENLTGSTGFAVLRPRQLRDTEFVYLAATQESSIEYLAHVADGAAYPSVRPDVVLGINCIVPNATVLDLFHDVTSKTLIAVAENQKKSQTLAEIRDTLLPRLISGKLRLSEVEAQIEAIAS